MSILEGFFLFMRLIGRSVFMFMGVSEVVYEGVFFCLVLCCLFLSLDVRNVRRSDDWGKNGRGLVFVEVVFEVS